MEKPLSNNSPSEPKTATRSCSFCEKIMPDEKLIRVWENNGDNWHYCHGTWRWTPYPDDCYHYHNRSTALFLCPSCYRDWKKSKQKEKLAQQKWIFWSVLLTFAFVLSLLIVIFVFVDSVP